MTKETADAYGEKTDMFYDVPPWITKATGPVNEFMGRYIEREKRKLESVMMSQVRDRERRRAYAVTSIISRDYRRYEKW